MSECKGTLNSVVESLLSAINAYIRKEIADDLQSFIFEAFPISLKNNFSDDLIKFSNDQLQIIYDSNIQESILIHACQALSDALEYLEIPRYDKSKLLNEIVEDNRATKRIVFIDDSFSERNGFIRDSLKLNPSIISTTFPPPFPSALAWQCKEFAQTENYLMTNNEFCIPLENFDKRLFQLTGPKKKVAYIDFQSLSSLKPTNERNYNLILEYIKHLLENNISLVIFSNNESSIEVSTILNRLAGENPTFLSANLHKNDIFKLSSKGSIFIYLIPEITHENIDSQINMIQKLSLGLSKIIRTDILFPMACDQFELEAKKLNVPFFDVNCIEHMAYFDLKIYIDEEHYLKEGSHAFIFKSAALSLLEEFNKNLLPILSEDIPKDNTLRIMHEGLSNLKNSEKIKINFSENIIDISEENLRSSFMLFQPYKNVEGKQLVVYFDYYSVLRTADSEKPVFYKGAIDCINNLISLGILVVIISNLNLAGIQKELQEVLEYRVLRLNADDYKKSDIKSFFKKNKNLMIIDLKSMTPREDEENKNEFKCKINDLVKSSGIIEMKSLIISVLSEITGTIPLLFIDDSHELAEPASNLNIPFFGSFEKRVGKGVFSG